MDKRKALKKGYILSLRNSENGIVKYTIRDEIGRGGSCLVYDAYYSNNIKEERTVRIKECYPCRMKIERLENGELIPDEKDLSEFQVVRTRIIDSFRLNNQLFSDTSLTNSVSNTLDIYEQNGTVYIVSTFQAGSVLSKENISSLKDAVNIVKAVAKTVRNIHDNGFLYLDIKPSNIYVYEGATEVVQLFDFDSLIPIDAFKSEPIEKYRISFSSGFAALEQKTANIKRIGKHTDVFGVGALLFYLVFGSAPTAFDCELDASYKYEQGQYPIFQYQDKLFRELTDFFHKSIASYYADRYEDLNVVIDKLQIIAGLSDIEKPFIFSTPIIAKKELVGRETELEQIDNYLQTNNCLFVTGMGGIGKSSLVRTYVHSYKDEYDNCVYLYYQGSTIELIADDSQLHINTVQREIEETAEEYFRRKTLVLRRLLKETSSLLVIDNFSGEIDKTLLSVFSLGWKVIVISREEAPSDEYPQIKVSAVKERKDLYHLFELYLKREISDEEYPYIGKIIDKVSGHSLVLELIAKQILNSHISIEQACSIVEENGFSEIAPEKIEYEKDSLTSSETIHNIIEKLFPSERYGVDYKKILKGLSLFDSRGIQITTFSEMLTLESLDCINELINDQWIESNGDYISLHSVIKEVINTWIWEKEYKGAAVDIIKYLFTRLKLEGQREEIPADHLQVIKKLKEISESKNIFAKWRLERIRKKNLIGEILIQRVERGGDEALTNRDLVAQLLSLSEVVIQACSRIEDINDSDLYKSLIYQVIIKMPKDREEYVLQHCLDLLNSGYLKPVAKYDLYDRVVSIYSGKHDYERAWEVIQKARRGLAFKNNKVKGLYYSFLAEFYDARLDGAYATDNEYHDRGMLLKAIDDSIKYFSRDANNGTTGYQLTQSYISKANVLIRCFPEKEEEISNVLRETGDLCAKYTQSFSSLRRDYYMCRAWYFTYVCPNSEGCTTNIEYAYEIEKEISTSDLESIDNSYVPFANMCIEFGWTSDAVGLLEDAIKLCEKDAHLNVIPYIRKRAELYSHLLEIYYFEKDIANGRNVLAIIDEMNRQYSTVGINYEIPNEIRDSFSGSLM